MDEHMLKEFYIPKYIIVPDSKAEVLPCAPNSPVIVFINSKSGGQLGGELLQTYRQLLSEAQVVDLGKEAPDKVLYNLYANLERLKTNGDMLATEIEHKLRLIVAGGDGTAGWLLGVVSDLKLTRSPPIATVPLGTGNNLPFSFGWGKKNPGTDRQSVEYFLNQVMNAGEMKIDSWHIIMRMRAPKEGACDPIAPLELPHSLHAFQRVSHTDSLNVEGYHTFRGGFWNYFSMGMDAQVSYAFHSERKLHPEKFKNQLVNQSTYAKLGCTQGWFCATLFHPSSRNIAQLAKIKIMKRHGHWEELHIPRSIRSIVCLNLPSFSGGFNPWGTPNHNKARDRNLTPPYVDDGHLEVVGFRDAWHGLVLLSPNGHGTRLAQAHRIRFEFHKGSVDHTYMRMDGEPWKQPLPENDGTVVVEISHLGQANMLVSPNCISKSVLDPTTPSSASGHQGDDDSSTEDSEDESWEEKRKFGAADTFKLPEDIDIAHLSLNQLPELSSEYQIHDDEGTARMRDACELAARVLEFAGRMVRPSITTNEIDKVVHNMIIDAGAYPSPLGYGGFPKSVCTSVNECMCHGIPDSRQLQDGDIINIDVTVYLNGYHGDTSKTFLCGEVNEPTKRLVKVTEECLERAIAVCKDGCSFKKIGKRISEIAERYGFGVVERFVGHGVGTIFHSEPIIMHNRNDKSGSMVEGQAFTIEPILTMGTIECVTWDDGWTTLTADGRPSAQFEHTILVTRTGAEVLTKC